MTQWLTPEETDPVVDPRWSQWLTPEEWAHENEATDRGDLDVSRSDVACTLRQLAEEATA